MQEATADKFIRVTDLRNHKLKASQMRVHISASNRYIPTSTVWRKQCESVLHGRFAAQKSELREANKKKTIESR